MIEGLGDIANELHERLPKDLQDKMIRLVEVNGKVVPEMLNSDEIAILMREAKAMDAGGKVVKALEEDVVTPEEIVDTLLDGLDLYTELTKDLVAAFHSEDLHKQTTRLYNACACFVRMYNIAEMEHGECLKKGKE